MNPESNVSVAIVWYLDYPAPLNILLSQYVQSTMSTDFSSFRIGIPRRVSIEAISSGIAVALKLQKLAFRTGTTSIPGSVQAKMSCPPRSQKLSKGH